MQMSFYYILASFLMSSLITFLVMPSIIRVALQKELYDVPNNRKVHSAPIPSLGGIGIFIGVLISFASFGMASQDFQFQYILVAFMILFFVGLKDDLVTMPAWKRLIAQLLIAYILAYSGLRIEKLYGIMGIEQLPLIWSYVLTMIFITGTINAFNLIDGVDGLAGGLGGINVIALGGLLVWLGDFEFSLLAFSIAGALLSFLYYNFRKAPNKIFMGDTGSTLLGLAVAILGIRFLQLPSTESISVAVPPMLVAGILIIPYFDMMRVMVIRISSGKSPFTPDKNHIHHEFVKAGVSHKHTSMMLYTINILFIFFVFMFRESSLIELGIIFVFLGIICILLLVFLRYRKHHTQHKKLSSKLNQLKRENSYL